MSAESLNQGMNFIYCLSCLWKSFQIYAIDNQTFPNVKKAENRNVLHETLMTL